MSMELFIVAQPQIVAAVVARKAIRALARSDGRRWSPIACIPALDAATVETGAPQTREPQSGAHRLRGSCSACAVRRTVGVLAGLRLALLRPEAACRLPARIVLSRLVRRTDMNTIEVHFNRMGRGGGTLVVVAIGTDVYGATAPEPLRALHAVALSAARDQTRRGQAVDPRLVVQHGLTTLVGVWLRSLASVRSLRSRAARAA
jgi:hypothetical protein